VSLSAKVRSVRAHTRVVFRRDNATRLAHAVRRDRITYLETPALVDLWDAVVEADRSGRRGSIVEAGTALGGSAVMLACARQEPRQIYLYDTFGLIPPPSEHDGVAVHERYDDIVAGRSAGLGGDTYYGYQGDLRRSVQASLEEHGADLRSVDLIQGLYESTFRPTWDVAVAHIDCDWYESVAVCLARVWPHVVTGGVVVIDDYDHWDGCRRAVEEFVAEHDDAVVTRRARLRLVKA